MSTPSARDLEIRRQTQAIGSELADIKSEMQNTVPRGKLTERFGVCDRAYTSAQNKRLDALAKRAGDCETALAALGNLR